MDVVFGMQPLNSLQLYRRNKYELIGKHQCCLQREFFIAHDEQVLNRWAKQIHDHQVRLVLIALPVYLRKADRSFNVF